MIPDQRELVKTFLRDSTLQTCDVDTWNALTALCAENAELRRATRTNPDYDLHCGRCGAPHNFDTSIPSGVWNKIAPEGGLLCTLCIDELLTEHGMKVDCAEFYYVGRSLSSRLYAESTREVQNLRDENDQLRNERDRLVAEAKATIKAACDGAPSGVYGSVAEMLTDQHRKELDELRAIIAANLHQRKCHDCGHVDYYADCIVPYCICKKCASQDTRKVKP